MSPSLVKKGVIPVEAEVLVTASYRFATGVDLPRLDLYFKTNEAFPLAATEKVVEWSELRAEGRALAAHHWSSVFES